jgi:ABC-2 type transport system permease protein
MTAFLNHFSFEFRTGIRDKNLLFLNYMFPLIFYLMMGFIMGEINPGFIDTIVPGMAVFAVMAACLMGIPVFIVKAREDGIFRSYKVNGVPPLPILLVPALTTALHMTIVMLLIGVTAGPLFGAPLPASWGAFMLVFTALAVAMAGISVMIGVISPTTNFQVMLSQLIFIPSILLGGMMVPLSILPATAVSVARLLPAAQAMNAFNSLAMGLPADFNAWGSVASLFMSGIVGFGIASYMFNTDPKNMDQRGHMLLGLLVLAPFALGFLLG